MANGQTQKCSCQEMISVEYVRYCSGGAWVVPELRSVLYCDFCRLVLGTNNFKLIVCMQARENRQLRIKYDRWWLACTG